MHKWSLRQKRPLSPLMLAMEAVCTVHLGCFFKMVYFSVNVTCYIHHRIMLKIVIKKKENLVFQFMNKQSPFLCSLTIHHKSHLFNCQSTHMSLCEYVCLQHSVSTRWYVFMHQYKMIKCVCNLSNDIPCWQLSSIQYALGESICKSV